MFMNTISMHRLVSGLVQSLMPLTIGRRNLVLNEIPGDLRVAADESMLAYVLWTLINSVIQSTRDKCIHVEAIKADQHTMIRIRGGGTYFYHSIAREYRQVQHVAQKLGGSISIHNATDYGMNAAFVISNRLLTA
jgi:hypothetical protein